MTKLRVIGYIPLMYGAEYLDACIKSMEPVVEKIMVIYSDQGSQGHRTNIPCPETEQQLKSIALSASPKVEWHKDYFPNEGAHRNWIYQHTSGYDMVLTLDADEVVEPRDVEEALWTAYKGDKRFYGIDGFINFWRSFNHVCLDGFRPYRIVNLRQGQHSTGEVKMRVYHFGCCQGIDIVRFKWNVSGHKSELKHNWIDGTYLAWNPENNFGDLHCVSNNLWNTVPFDKNDLPEILKQHPNFNRTQI